jgi:hypothetical protein
MHMKCRSGLAIALVGLALLVANSAARAGQWFSLGCCSAPVKVCTSQAHAIEFVGAGHPACDPCAIRFYSTCWQPAFPADYSHCQTDTLCTPLATPVAPQESRQVPAREDELPKPRPKIDQLPKPDPKDPTGKSQLMNIIYHVDETPPQPMLLSQPIRSAGPVLR